MSNIQARIEAGWSRLSRLRVGFEQGKQKRQSTEEISTLYKAVEETSADKAKLLLELGQLTHLMLRDGKINVDERPELSLLEELSHSLVHVDRTLFRVRQQIQQMREEETIGSNAQGTRSCVACETNIPSKARFCGCCGTKQAL